MPAFGPYYTTLAACRRQLKLDAAATLDDEEIADAIVAASQTIEDFCGHHFDPRIETRYFNGDVGQFNPELYLSGEALLEATTILNGDGTTIASSNYTLLPRGEYPKDRVRLATSNYWTGSNPYDGSGACGTPVLVHSAYAEDSIAITGVWGYHRDYSRAWRSTGLTLTAAVSTTTATSIAVSADGILDVGNLIKVDTEWMYITGPIADTAHALTFTVERGVNGSTAATHSLGAAVSVWRVEAIIEKAARMLVAAQFRAKDNATGEVMSISGMGTVSTRDVPQKVKDMLVYPYWNFQKGQAS